jgi:GxxExxY protein
MAAQVGKVAQYKVKGKTKLSKKIDLTCSDVKAVPKVSLLSDLDEHLPSICSSIFSSLSSRQCEATYQRCLSLDLEEAGVNVESEVEITLTYKGRDVGSRRADLVLTLADGNAAVVELKAVGTLLSEHLKQLEFYMHYMQIGIGYLINFPHDTGFPEVPENDGCGGGGGGGGPAMVFHQRALSGSALCLSDRIIRASKAGEEVQIIKVTRKIGDRPTDATLSAVPRQATFGVTQKGLPCKTCMKQHRFCDLHKNQEKGGSNRN